MADGGHGELICVLDTRQGAAGSTEDLDERLAAGIAEENDASIGHGVWGSLIAR